MNIFFIDANTIWHRRLAEALSALVPTLALLPRAGIVPSLSVALPEDGEGGFVQVVLPRGWASATAPIAQRLLAKMILSREVEGSVAIITSPVYQVLARCLAERLPLVYYCADDYRSYVGWGRRQIAAEADICRLSTLSVFVSEALRVRAIEEYGLDPIRTLTSPNATEPRFYGSQSSPSLLFGKPRPVLGMLGALTDRLDVSVVGEAAMLPSVGTFLIAGPVTADLVAREPWLSDPKVIVTGTLPHENMHHFARAMDCAIIAYSATELNYYCSPMRLYDHLATGVKIFALDTCDQINRLNNPQVISTSAELLPGVIAAQVGSLRCSSDAIASLWPDRAKVLIEKIESTLERY